MQAVVSSLPISSVLMKPLIVSPPMVPSRLPRPSPSMPLTPDVVTFALPEVALLTFGWMSDTFALHTSAIAPALSPLLTLLTKSLIVTAYGSLPPELELELELLLLLRDDGEVEVLPELPLVVSLMFCQH